ncbi:MAG: C40 family peptidase [Fibrobacteres bacterium]|nr:C40 family peptidase [Fibrobacterota bacterium]
MTHAARSLPQILLAVGPLLFLSACGPLVRPYYNRNAGGYIMPDPSLTPTPIVPAALKHVSTGEDPLRKAAEAYLGVPYSFGGQSRSGMDCSGFIRQVFAEVYGVDLPHNSSALYHRGAAVERASLAPGDLVFFENLGFIDHAGIYMGKGYFIHSATSVGVAYSALDAPYFGDHYAGARRLDAASHLDAASD